MLCYFNHIPCRRPANTGFTVIELMISITVVALLVAFALPAYNEYDVRTKVSECIDAAESAKLSISEYRNAFDSWPPDAEEAALTDNGHSGFCEGFVAYDPSDGSFQLDIRESAIGENIGRIQPKFTPRVTASDTIEWLCTAGVTAPLRTNYLPGECRGG